MSYQPNQSFYFSTDSSNKTEGFPNKRLDEFRRRHDESNIRHEAYFKDSNLKSKAENLRLYQSYVENSDKKINYSTQLNEHNSNTAELTAISRHSVYQYPQGPFHSSNFYSCSAPYVNVSTAALIFSSNPYIQDAAKGNNNFHRQQHLNNTYERFGINPSSATKITRSLNQFASTFANNSSSAMIDYEAGLTYAQPKYALDTSNPHHKNFEMKSRGVGFNGTHHAQYYQKVEPPLHTAVYNGYPTPENVSSYHQLPPPASVRPINYSQQPGGGGTNTLPYRPFYEAGAPSHDQFTYGKGALQSTFSVPSSAGILNGGPPCFQQQQPNKINGAFETTARCRYDPTSYNPIIPVSKYYHSQGSYTVPYTYANHHSHARNSNQGNSYPTSLCHVTSNDLPVVTYTGPFTSSVNSQQQHYPIRSQRAGPLNSSHLDGNTYNQVFASNNLIVPGTAMHTTHASMSHGITTNNHNNSYPVQPSHNFPQPGASKGATTTPMTSTPSKAPLVPTSKEEKAAARKHYRQMLKAQKRAALTQEGQSNPQATNIPGTPEIRTKRKYNTSNHNKQGKNAATDKNQTSKKEGNQQPMSEGRLTNQHDPNCFPTVTAPSQTTGNNNVGYVVPTTSNNIQAFLDTYEITDDLINNGDAFGDIVFGAGVLASSAGAQLGAFRQISQNSGPVTTTFSFSSISKPTTFEAPYATATYHGALNIDAIPFSANQLPRPNSSTNLTDDGNRYDFNNHLTIQSTTTSPSFGIKTYGPRTPPLGSNRTFHNNSALQQSTYPQSSATNLITSVIISRNSSSLANNTSVLGRPSSNTTHLFAQHSQLYEEEESHLVKMNRLVDINTAVTPIHGTPESLINLPNSQPPNNGIAQNTKNNNLSTSGTVPKKSNAGRKRTKNISGIKNNIPPKFETGHHGLVSSNERLSKALLGNPSASYFASASTKINNPYEFEIKAVSHYSPLGHVMRQPLTHVKEGFKHLSSTTNPQHTPDPMPNSISWSNPNNVNRHLHALPSSSLSQLSNKSTPSATRLNNFPQKDASSFLSESDGQQNRATHLQNYLTRPSENNLMYNNTYNNNYHQTANFSFSSGQRNPAIEQPYQYQTSNAYSDSTQAKSFPYSSQPSSTYPNNIPRGYLKNTFFNPLSHVEISKNQQPATLDDLLSYGPPPQTKVIGLVTTTFGTYFHDKSQANLPERPNDLELKPLFPTPVGSAIASVDEFEMLLLGRSSTTTHHANPKSLQPKTSVFSVKPRDYTPTSDGSNNYVPEISPISGSSANFDFFKPPSGGGGAGSSATSGIASCSSSLSTASSNSSSVTTPEELMNQQLAHERSILCEFAATADFFSA